MKSECFNASTVAEAAVLLACTKVDTESCPVCQEQLGSQKMVFQCGHVTCCKCKSASAIFLFCHTNIVHEKMVLVEYFSLFSSS